MMRWVVPFLMLAPSLAAAQEWSVQTRISAERLETFTHDGAHVGLATRDPEGEWLGTDVFTAEGADPASCAKQSYLALDHYYGLDDIYSVNVFADLFADGAEKWDVTEPAIFFDRLSANDTSFASYEGFDDITVKVTDLRCLGNMVAMALSYSGVLYRYEGAGPETMKIAGNARFQVPLQPYEDF